MSQMFMNDDSQATLRPADYRARILNLRHTGDLAGAIELCREACNRFPTDGFYHKIAGDIFFSSQNYDSASKAYLDYLERMSQTKVAFVQFAQRYNRLRRVWTKEKVSEYAATIMTMVEHSSSLSEEISLETKNLVAGDLPAQSRAAVPLSEAGAKLELLFKEQARDKQLFHQSRMLERSNKLELTYLLDEFVLDRERTAKTFNQDGYWIAVYEKLEQPRKALKITEELLNLRMDNGLIRTFFRLERKIGSYDHVNKFINDNPHILKSDVFHVLYELVYYYDFNKDYEGVTNTLERIRKTYAQNVPIRKTLRNLYIRFGMVSEANQIEQELEQEGKGNRRQGSKYTDTISSKYADTIKESEVELGSKIKDLYEELEVAKRIAAISDLTTGISHELGQPITNIRYAIQFSRKEFERQLTKEEVFRVFDSILEETERMGGLVKRLSPLTSSRAVIEDFDIIDRINRRVSAEKARLQTGGIRVVVHPASSVYFHGDPVKFDQLISNLLLNAIDAINESPESSKRIRIDVSSDSRQIKILFEDDGIGIPAAGKNKVFDPFYTTKAPGKGEGLGLFIVWNLLKMQGGQIRIDPKMKRGTRFLIRIPKPLPKQESERKSEQHIAVS